MLEGDAFRTEKCGSYLQRLINKMFLKLMGVTVEACIDDMVIKIQKAEDHICDASEVFEIFRQFKMKLNPIKCDFGVSSG